VSATVARPSAMVGSARRPSVPGRRFHDEQAWARTRPTADRRRTRAVPSTPLFRPSHPV
jgi:hypothetical protein